MIEILFTLFEILKNCHLKRIKMTFQLKRAISINHSSRISEELQNYIIQHFLSILIGKFVALIFKIITITLYFNTELGPIKDA